MPRTLERTEYLLVTAALREQDARAVSSVRCPSPVLPGAESWSSPGASDAPGSRGRLGTVLIHGFSGNPISLRPLAEGLADAGFAVELPRLPGHGTHPRDLGRTRYSDWRAAVVEAVDRSRARRPLVALLGLSMGGTLALDLAASDARTIAAVVCINPQVLQREGLLVKLGPWLSRFVPSVPAALAGLRRDDIAKPGVSEGAYRWISTAAGLSFTRELPRIRELIGHLDCPLLVAHSLRDHCVPPANSKMLLDLVPGARELVLERSFHVASLDYDLELLVRHTTAFLDRVADMPGGCVRSASTRS